MKSKGMETFEWGKNFHCADPATTDDGTQENRKYNIFKSAALG